jgi:hypothetical protein
MITLHLILECCASLVGKKVNYAKISTLHGGHLEIQDGGRYMIIFIMSSSSLTLIMGV